MGVRFSWSILADDSVFEVGDWIQGFTTMPEPHGSVVDLLVVWSIEESVMKMVAESAMCASALPG